MSGEVEDDSGVGAGHAEIRIPEGKAVIRESGGHRASAGHLLCYALMSRAVRQLYHRARDLKQFIVNDELHSPVRVPLRIRLKSVSRGFLSRSYIMYNLAENDHRLYLSDAAKRQTLRINASEDGADYQVVMSNKLVFDAVVGSHARVPAVYAYIAEGVIHPRREWLAQAGSGPSEICRRFGKPIVFKPVTGQKGRGAFFVRLDGEQLVVNEKHVGDAALDARVKLLDDYFASEYIAQSDFAAALYPHTPNTIRMITMLDPDSQEPFIPAAVQRIGTRDSLPVDNFSRGALGSGINLETGELTRAAALPRTGRLIWHESHPETGAPIAGLVTPNWSALRERLIAVARALPFLKAVAWDVLQTDDGFALLEANGTADVSMLQMHYPLLRDERVRRFLKHHRVI